MQAPLEAGRALARRGPSGTAHADALSSCPSQRLRQLAQLYPRPAAHQFFNLLASPECEVRLFGVFKVGTTFLTNLVVTKGARIRRRPHVHSRCRTVEEWRDHSARADKNNASHLATERAKYARLVQQTTSYFSAALTREPTERFLSGYHEHFVHFLRTPGQVAVRPNATRSARLESLERFVDRELTLAPASSADGRHFSRDFHVAPQVTFLTDWLGRPHRIDYIGAGVGDSERMRRELHFLGLMNASGSLPRVTGAGRPAVVEDNFRRVHAHEVAGGGDATARLQRKICTLLIADYCCLNYSFPPACAGLTC